MAMEAWLEVRVGERISSEKFLTADSADIANKGSAKAESIGLG
jgi:hypothetical protein